MNRIHLAIVVRGADPPSAVSSVALHHTRELSQKFCVSVLSDIFPEVARSGLTDGDFTPIEFTVPKFDFLRRLCHVPNELAFLWCVYRHLKRLHSEHPIDFIWCHSHPVAAWPLYYMCRQFGIPYGLTVHGDIFERPKGTYDPFLTQFYRMATPIAYRRASVIQVLAPVWKQSVLRWGIDDHNVVVIPNGVSLSEFSPVSRTIRGHEDPLRVLFVGRLVAPKGADTLIHAAVILKRREVHFEILLIGDGPKANALKSLSAKNDLNEQVQFLGSIPRTKLGQYYAAVDVVCVPSISEPLATVVLESLAHGTPVLASKVGGNSYLIEDGHNGWLIEPNDPIALANCLEMLAKDREICNSMAQNAQQSISKSFSWEQIGETLVDVVLSKARPVRR